MDSPVLDDLAAEQSVLDELVSDLNEVDWDTASPAEGWNVRDEIAHLALFDDIAVSSLTGSGDERFAEIYAAVQRGEDGFVTAPGAGRSGAAVLREWREACTAELAAFGEIDPGHRVPWGPNRMTAVSLCTARLMETWAHGLDCFRALGVEPIDTDRLRHVCHITYRAIPNALVGAGRAMPAPLTNLVVEVTSPTGTLWRFGDRDAPERIEGTASEFARVGVRRMRFEDAKTLRVGGPLAELAMANLKAYL